MTVKCEGNTAKIEENNQIKFAAEKSIGNPLVTTTVRTREKRGGFKKEEGESILIL